MSPVRRLGTVTSLRRVTACSPMSPVAGDTAQRSPRAPALAPGLYPVAWPWVRGRELAAPRVGAVGGGGRGHTPRAPRADTASRMGSRGACWKGRSPRPQRAVMPVGSRGLRGHTWPGGSRQQEGGGHTAWSPHCLPEPPENVSLEDCTDQGHARPDREGHATRRRTASLLAPLSSPLSISHTACGGDCHPVTQSRVPPFWASNQSTCPGLLCGQGWPGDGAPGSGMSGAGMCGALGPRLSPPSGWMQM